MRFSSFVPDGSARHVLTLFSCCSQHLLATLRRPDLSFHSTDHAHRDLGRPPRFDAHRAAARSAQVLRGDSHAAERERRATAATLRSPTSAPERPANICAPPATTATSGQRPDPRPANARTCRTSSGIARSA